MNNMKTLESEIDKLRAENATLLRAISDHVTVRSQLREENAALAEQNAKMREALVTGLAQITVLGVSPDPTGPYCDRVQVAIRQELCAAITLPDLSTPVINKWKAEAYRECAERVGRGLMSCKGYEELLNAAADELEGKK